MDLSVHSLGDRPPGAPIIFDDRVEDLVEILSVTPERLPENSFLHRARLEHRPVAPSVQYGHARSESMHTECFERERENQVSGLLERPRAPERRSDRKPPLRTVETPLCFDEPWKIPTQRRIPSS